MKAQLGRGAHHAEAYLQARGVRHRGPRAALDELHVQAHEVAEPHEPWPGAGPDRGGAFCGHRPETCNTLHYVATYSSARELRAHIVFFKASDPGAIWGLEELLTHHQSLYSEDASHETGNRSLIR